MAKLRQLLAALTGLLLLGFGVGYLALNDPSDISPRAIALRTAQQSIHRLTDARMPKDALTWQLKIPSNDLWQIAVLMKNARRSFTIPNAFKRPDFRGTLRLPNQNYDVDLELVGNLTDHVSGWPPTFAVRSTDNVGSLGTAFKLVTPHARGIGHTHVIAEAFWNFMQNQLGTPSPYVRIADVAINERAAYRVLIEENERQFLANSANNGITVPVEAAAATLREPWHSDILHIVLLALLAGNTHSFSDQNTLAYFDPIERKLRFFSNEWQVDIDQDLNFKTNLLNSQWQLELLENPSFMRQVIARLNGLLATKWFSQQLQAFIDQERLILDRFNQLTMYETALQAILDTRIQALTETWLEPSHCAEFWPVPNFDNAGVLRIYGPKQEFVIDSESHQINVEQYDQATDKTSTSFKVASTKLPQGTISSALQLRGSMSYGHQLFKASLNIHTNSKEQTIALLSHEQCKQFWPDRFSD